MAYSSPISTDWLRYANQSAVRSQPISQQLQSALSFLPDMGVTMEVFSGGQPSEGANRVGSHRHDQGGAADVFFYKDGRKLDWANPSDRPVFEEIVKRGRERGITGIGAGDNYMRPGSMHIGFGNEAVWGAGGKGSNAPDWLRNAYYGAEQGAMPEGVQVAQAGEFNPFSMGAKPVGGSPAPAQADQGGFDPFALGAKMIQDIGTADVKPIEGPPAPIPMQAPNPDYQQPEPPPGMQYDPQTGQMYDESLRQGGLEPDRVSTFVEGFAEGLPIVGPTARDAMNTGAAYGRSAIYGGTPEEQKQKIVRMSELGKERYPGTDLAGQVTGSVLPLVGLGATATGAKALGITGESLAGRALASGASGAVLSGADTAARGGNAGDIARSLAYGAGIGAAIPVVGSGMEAGGRAIKEAVAPRFNALFRPGYESARRVGAAVTADRQMPGVLNQADEAAVVANNQRLLNVDRGGETTRALARAASNVDPEARAIITRTADDRFAAQYGRAKDFVSRIMGGQVDDIALQQKVREAARIANKPAYQKAYSAPEAQSMWDEGFQQLMQAPAMEQAAKGATKRGANRAAVEGFNPIKNPFVVENGRLALKTMPDGSVAKPTLQFWDQTKRNLDDMIGAAQRAGNRSYASDLMNLKTALVDHLDELVPSYKNARAGAARFFDAEDAIDAGKKFVSQNKDLRASEKAIKAMTPQERKAFSIGFSAELTDKMGSVRDRSNVIDRIFGNPNARKKIELALGPRRAREFEQFARIETAMDQLRGALGNSNTARQLVELGMAGARQFGVAGAAGTASGLYTEDIKTGVLTGLAVQGAKFTGMKIDENVAKKMAKLLVSEDPQAMQRAITLATNSPKYAAALKAIQNGVGAFARGELVRENRPLEITVTPKRQNGN